MSPTAPERSAPRPVDAAALARVQRRLQSAAGAPWLHGEVARRMAERLPVIRLQPDRVLDWGAHVGGSRPLLGRSYPKARIVAVESDAAACAATAAALQSPWWSPRRWLGQPPQVLTAASLAPAAGQLLWSNMGLHGVVDPQAEMASWHRAIAVDGFLMFSTLGPGTLQALSELYAQQGWGPAMAPLVDMHDLGDMLVQAGFADPVMDQETLSLSWPSAAALLAELRALGGNADPRRCAGLRARHWRRSLVKALEQHAGPDGRIALQFELVYGHAFKPMPRHRVAARTEVALDDMRTMVRAASRRV